MPLPVRNRSLVTATEAKNTFGHLMEKAMQGEVVVITKHDTPKVVLISMDEYTTLSSASEMRLDTLSTEFDALLMRMQRARTRSKMRSAFHASPKQLGKAARIAARKRG
jgi:antitoxin Phd